MKRKLPLLFAPLAGGPSSAIAQNDPGGYGHMMDWGSWMLWWPFHWIFWLAVVVIVVLIILRLVGGRDDRTNTEEDEALRILRNRYAKGEITKDEYEEIRRDLER